MRINYFDDAELIRSQAEKFAKKENQALQSKVDMLLYQSMILAGTQVFDTPTYPQYQAVNNKGGNNNDF